MTETVKTCHRCTKAISCTHLYFAGSMMLCNLTSTTHDQTIKNGECNPDPLVDDKAVYCLIHARRLLPVNAANCAEFDVKGAKKAHPVPVNAQYLYPRRTCEHVDTKLDCSLKADGGFCGFSEANEVGCPQYVHKEPKTNKVKFMLKPEGGFVVIENGISTHYKEPFDCAKCQDFAPGKAEEKCAAFCPFTHDPATFKCVGICSHDGHTLTISRQHPAGYLFCLHACPVAKSKPHDLVKVGTEGKPKKARKKKDTFYRDHFNELTADDITKLRAAPATTPNAPGESHGVRTKAQGAIPTGHAASADGGNGKVEAAAKKPRKAKPTPAPPEKPTKKQTTLF